MRVLYAGHADLSEGLVRFQSPTNFGRGAPRSGGQSVPMHELPEDNPRDLAGRGQLADFG